MSVASATLPAGESKFNRTLRARRGLVERWRALTASRRDVSRALVWFHAPSVGEGLQARPIIDALRRARPDVQVAYTFFSPSAEKFANTLGADMTDYLPFDNARDMGTLLDLIQPAALMFAKLDVWPNLVAAAHARGVTTGLLSGTMAPGSSRQGALAKMLLHDAYAALDVVGAIDADDASRLIAAGVRPTVVSVTGDTRFDQTWARAAQVNRNSDVLKALASSRPTIVAGSTWPADESVLMPAFVAARLRVPQARLLVAPHEPTREHVATLIAHAKRHNLSVTLLSRLLPHHGVSDRFADANATKPASADTDVVIIDSVGMLGDIYALATVAYVGGAFHKAGLHSVLEPAAFGAPVIFGPNYKMSREASLLLEHKGAKSVSTIEQLADALGNWLTNSSVRDDNGLNALNVVRNGIGAAEKSLELVLNSLA